MADYAIANQIRPFQLPDIAGIANAMSSQSLNAMREDQLLQQSQQLRGAEAERGALRELFSRPGFDPLAPGSAREILQVAPTTGPATFNALMRARADQRAGDASARAGAAADRAAAVAGVEMAVKNTALFRDMFANATPENYAAIRAAAVRAVPQWDTALPTGYTPDGVQRILMTADRALARHFVNQTGDDGMQRVLSIPRYGEGPAAVVPGSESAARPQRMMGPSGPIEISGGPGGSSYTMIPPAGMPAAPGAPLAVPEPMAPAPAPMVPGPRTGAAPAMPINAMLAPQDAAVVGQPLAVPDFARLAAPRTITEADLNKRLLDVQQSQATARAAAEVQRENAGARATEAGETTAAQTRAKLEAEEAVKRRQDVERLDTAIREVEKIIRPGGLLQQATGSGAGALRDTLGNFVGMSSRAADAAAAIPPIADLVLKMVPRFEGPQSERDVKVYEKAAGDLSNPTIPNPQRLAAARQILRLMRDRRGQFSYSESGGGAPASSAPAAPSAPAPGAVQDGYRFKGGNPADPRSWERL